MSRAKNLLDIWDLYSKQVMTEKKILKVSKPGPGPVDLNDKTAGDIADKHETGPDGVDNFDGPAFDRNISDLKTMSDKDKEKKPYVSKLNVSVEKIDVELQKTTKTIINNNMKSTFDKLFEEVMNTDGAQDLEALGIDAGGEDAAVSDEGMGDEGMGGDVTVTLTADQVDVLKAILSQLEGGSDEMSDEAGESDDDMGDEEDAEYAPEGMTENIEAKEVPDSAGQALTKHSHMKVGDKTSKLANKGKADSKVTATVDGVGKDVPDSDGESLTHVKNNKPHSKIKGGNQELFGV
jgi:hypothetical protein